MSRESARGRISRGRPDAEAFMELVREHDRGLRVLAYRLLRDRTAMDDAMQDAYLKAFRSFPEFRGEAQARTWLYRIVYNTCLDRLRSDQRRREVPLEPFESDAGGGRDGHRRMAGGQAGFFVEGTQSRTEAFSASRNIDVAKAVAERNDLAAALALLPIEQRAVVLLVDAGGFSYDEAAVVLDVRPGTIGSRLNHAHTALKTTLGAREG